MFRGQDIAKFNLSFRTCGYLYDLLKAKLIFARIITGMPSTWY